MTYIGKSSATPFPSAEIHGITKRCSSITLYKRPRAEENTFLVTTNGRDWVSEPSVLENVPSNQQFRDEWRPPVATHVN